MRRSAVVARMRAILMNAFQYKSGRLHCEGVSLAQLAKEFGTPLYVYSRNHIVGQWRALDKAFAGVEHHVCYAVKANLSLIHI